MHSNSVGFGPPTAVHNLTDVLALRRNVGIDDTENRAVGVDEITRHICPEYLMRVGQGRLAGEVVVRAG